MSDQDKPLDHATARIISELTAGLLPHLKETVSVELSAAVKSLPINVDKEVEEALASLKHLKDVGADMADALVSARDSVSRLTGELLPLSRACETIGGTAARLDAERKNSADINAVNELSRTLEASLSDWGAVLKATGHAQTKELNDFSTEVAEQINWIKSVMPGEIISAFEKVLSSYMDDNQVLKLKLTELVKIGKITLAASSVFIALLVGLYLK